MVKGSYEFADIVAIKRREEELGIREEKERCKIFRICPKCGERKPIYQFSKDKKGTNGRTNICKKCRVIEYLEYYSENRDKILTREKKYRDTHKGHRSIYYKGYQKENRERLSKLAKVWYQANKEAIKKRNLKYFEANKEACLVRRKIWVENNREKIRLYNSEYKRKIKGG